MVKIMRWGTLVGILYASVLQAFPDILVQIMDDTVEARPKVRMCKVAKVVVPENPSLPGEVHLIDPEGRPLIRTIPRKNAAEYGFKALAFTRLAKSYDDVMFIANVKYKPGIPEQGNLGQISAVRWDPFLEDGTSPWNVEVATHSNGKQVKVITPVENLKKFTAIEKQRYGVYDRQGRLVVVVPLSKGKDGATTYVTVLDREDWMKLDQSSNLNTPPLPRKINIQELVLLDRDDLLVARTEATKMVAEKLPSDFGEIGAPAMGEQSFEGDPEFQSLRKLRQQVANLAREGRIPPRGVVPTTQNASKQGRAARMLGAFFDFCRKWRGTGK